ncbi:MAG: Imm8 family immunity protein [Planctomycetota bacterium]
MKPEIKFIMDDQADAFDENSSLAWDEPWNAHAWFQVDVGIEDQEGADYFQVLVATPLAFQRIKHELDDKRVLLVDEMTVPSILQGIHDLVEDATASTWQQTAINLSKHMHWEYEGMAGSPVPSQRDRFPR